MEKYVLKLDTPLEYGNTKIEKLEFDFSKLTGNDLIEAEKEMSADVAYPEFNGEYLAILAAKAVARTIVLSKSGVGSFHGVTRSKLSGVASMKQGAPMAEAISQISTISFS